MGVVVLAPQQSPHGYRADTYLLGASVYSKYHLKSAIIIA